ncbi:hypothetical protein GW17_00029044 [Ensete ventricosum]|nr:hypothetical protein GW17_00029044 [Ensete ventricosum]
MRQSSSCSTTTASAPTSSDTFPWTHSQPIVRTISSNSSSLHIYADRSLQHLLLLTRSWLAAYLPQSATCVYLQPCLSSVASILIISSCSLVFSYTSTPAVATEGVLAPLYTRTRPSLVLLASTLSLFCFSNPSSFSNSINLTQL